MKMPANDYDKSDVNRLLKTLRHQEADRVPHIELWVTSQEVYEYVLERKLDYIIGDAAEGQDEIVVSEHPRAGAHLFPGQVNAIYAGLSKIEPVPPL